MHGVVGDAFALGGMNECVEQSEGVHFWLEVVIEHSLECRHLRIHYHYALCDSCASQRHALVGHCHGEIVHAMLLQGAGNLHSSRAIAVGLYHADELRLGFHQRAIVVKVVDKCRQVHLECCLVHFANEHLA